MSKTNCIVGLSIGIPVYINFLVMIVLQQLGYINCDELVMFGAIPVYAAVTIIVAFLSIRECRKSPEREDALLVNYNEDMV